jgi:hypothetical protein
LSRRLEGTSDEGGLLQKIRPHQDGFKRSIRATAPYFIPWESDTHREDLPEAEFLTSEEDEKLVPKTEKIYVNDVLHHAQRYLSLLLALQRGLNKLSRARTRELPDNYPFIVQKEYIQEFTEKWATPSKILFDQVHDILKDDLSALVEEHFSKMGRGGAHHGVLYVSLALIDMHMLRRSFLQYDSA